MAKPDIGTMIVDGELYTLIGVAEFNHIIREVPYNVELFVKKIHENMISRDVLIQRTPDQWTNKMKSRLIESVLKNYQIGVFLTACGRSESQCYTVNSLIDGLQRATALVDYVDNKLALSRDAPPIKCRWKNSAGNIIERTFNISGKKFKHLPLILQKQILEYKITTYSYENFTDEELDEIVFSTNNGKAPAPFHKLRFALGTENMRLIQPLCNSALWDNVSGCKAKNDGALGCVIRTFMLMTGNYLSGLTTSAMAKFVASFDELITTSKIEQVGKLIEQLAGITESMTENDLQMLDGCSVPHFIANLKYYNSICEKSGNPDNKSYLDFFREFAESKDYTEFSAYKAARDDNGQKGEKSGSGGTQYSAESVDDRQYIIDSFLEDFFDLPLPHNGIRVDVESDTPDADIVDEPHTNIIQIKNTADVIDAEFDDNDTDDFVQTALNSD